MITKAAITTEKIVSALVSVKINVEPNKVLHTSPERLAGGEKMFIKKYPIARAPVEIMATLASPFIFEFSFVHKIKTANKTVTGRTKIVSQESFKTEAIAIAPNAVWESPSPM